MFSGPQLYSWPAMNEVAQPSDINKQAYDRQSTRRKKTLDFPAANISTPAKIPTTNSVVATGNVKSVSPKRRGSLVVLETEEFSEEQNQELDEWSALPGAPQAAPVHFDLFDDILDVFSDEVDINDDPTFLGNAWGVSMFEQAIFDADLAADLAYEKLTEESRVEQEKREPGEDEGVGDEVKATQKKKSPPLQSPHVSMLDSMNWILRDDAVMNDFQEKLESEYAAESLIFYRAAREFHVAAVAEKANLVRKQEQEGQAYGLDWSSSPSVEMAKSIYHKFIKAGSDHQINVNFCLSSALGLFFSSFPIDYDYCCCCSAQVPSIMVKNIRLALGIEIPLETSKREKAEKEALENGIKLDPPPPIELDPEVFASAIREVTVMLLKDKVPAYVSNEKAPRRVKMISEIEKCHRSQATWALDESLVADSSNTRRRLKDFIPDNSDDTHMASSISVKYFDPYFCSSPPPLATTMLASLGRFPFPPVPRLAPIAPATASPSIGTKQPPNPSAGLLTNSVLSPVECDPSSLVVEGGGGLHDIRSSYQEVASASLEEDMKAIDETPAKALIKIGVVYAKPRQYFQVEMDLK
jgi:hypothetical protein